MSKHQSSGKGTECYGLYCLCADVLVPFMRRRRFLLFLLFMRPCAFTICGPTPLAISSACSARCVAEPVDFVARLADVLGSCPVDEELSLATWAGQLTALRRAARAAAAHGGFLRGGRLVRGGKVVWTQLPTGGREAGLLHMA